MLFAALQAEREREEGEDKNHLRSGIKLLITILITIIVCGRKNDNEEEQGESGSDSLPWTDYLGIY